MEDGDVELGDVIGKTVQFLLDCEEKGRQRKSQLQPSIYMVPKGFRDLSPSSFNPQVVAIGPLHKGDENLQEFEERKLTYLHDFLFRFKLLPKKTLQACVEKVGGSINQIKACYTGIFDDTELATMMVMDGCFILEFFCKLSEQGGPLYTYPVITKCIADDLLRVENQIPFFVLKHVFECTILNFNPEASLTRLFLPFLMSVMNTILQANPLNIIDTGAADTSYDHILGLLHNLYQPSNRSRLSEIPKFHSATELDRAGVNFTPNDAATSLTAMKLEVSMFPWFWSKPTLKMPVVIIHDSTEMVLRNLIAYEQSSSLIPNYVTSYAYAMHMLIHTPDDVAKLVESKVIVNILASNERAANFLKNICKETVITDFFYQDEWDKLHAYYSRFWPSQIAGLKRTHFSNPWSIIAVLAGIILFILTLVQTIFTVTSTI